MSTQLMIEDLFAEGIYPFGSYNWETSQLSRTFQDNLMATLYIEMLPICLLTSARCGTWGRYFVKTGFLEVSANRPEESGQQTLSFNLQPSSHSPPGTPLVPIARYITRIPPRNPPTINMPSLAPPVPQQSPPISRHPPQFLPSPSPMFQIPIPPPVSSPLPRTQHKPQGATMWKWQPTVFGADITNTVGASTKAVPQKGSGRSQKRRRTEATAPQIASSSTDGTSRPMENTSTTVSWPWSCTIVCNVRESDCRFSAAGTEEMRDHLSTAHGIWKGKGTRHTAEGVKMPKERCRWGNCMSQLESSSVRKHVQANHIGPKRLRYVCGHCDKALSYEAKTQHEQGRCKGRQT